MEKDLSLPALDSLAEAIFIKMEHRMRTNSNGKCGQIPQTTNYGYFLSIQMFQALNEKIIRTEKQMKGQMKILKNKSQKSRN